MEEYDSSCDVIKELGIQNGQLKFYVSKYGERRKEDDWKKVQ